MQLDCLPLEKRTNEREIISEPDKNTQVIKNIPVAVKEDIIGLLKQ